MEVTQKPDKINFFQRQDELRRMTVMLLMLTAIGSAGIGCMGGLATGLLEYQLLTRTGAFDNPADLLPAVILGATLTLGITLLVIFVRLLMLHFSRRSSRRFFQARDLNDEAKEVALGQADRRLMNVVEEMAIAASVSMPHVFVMEEDWTINSFAMTRGSRSSIIGVTAGARNELTRDELQSVIAHEIAHISNGDAAINIRLLALIQGFRWFYDTSVLFIGAPFRTFESFKLAFFLAFYLTMLFGVFFVMGAFGVGIARLMQAAIARQREYLADASAVQFTRSTRGLLDALRRAGRAQQSRKHRPTHTAAFMMFVSPYRAQSWLLRTHPKIEQRIEATHAMTPGMTIDTSVAGANPTIRY
jgi:Zn-dependent protease with chaperone function